MLKEHIAMPAQNIDRDNEVVGRACRGGCAERKGSKFAFIIG